MLSIKFNEMRHAGWALYGSSPELMADAQVFPDVHANTHENVLYIA